MKNSIQKIGTGLGLVVVALVGLATAASAAPDAATVTAVTGGALTLKDTLIGIGEDVLPYGAAVVALVMGWRFARKFLRA
jgi:hypothetical protein